MTIPSNVTRNSYTGTGITGPYPVTFKFFEDADLKVTVADTNGVETVKVLTTDYTVTGAGEQAGGSITFTTAVTSGYSIVIEPVKDQTQDTDIKNEGGNLREAIEDRFDRLCRDDQVQQNQIDRSVKLKITDVATTDPELPTPEAGRVLRWNDTGTGIVNGSGASDSASDVSVIATGTTTARWLSDRLADYISLSDFGAVGDGITDNTAVVNAATALAAATGKCLVVKPGTYLCSSLTVPNNVELVFIGGILKAAAGATIDIRGPVSCHSCVQCFAFADNPTGANGVQPFKFSSPDASAHNRKETRVSVRWFGASGTSTGDDRAAIQCALSAVSDTGYNGNSSSGNNGACTVFFPRGKYLITGTLRVSSGTVLEGEHGGSTSVSCILRNDGAAGSMVVFQGTGIEGDENANGSQHFAKYMGFLFITTIGTGDTTQNASATLEFQDPVGNYDTLFDSCWLQGSPQNGAHVQVGNKSLGAGASNGLYVSARFRNCYFDVCNGTNFRTTDHGSARFFVDGGFIFQSYGGLFANTSDAANTGRIKATQLCVYNAEIYGVGTTSAINGGTANKITANSEVNISNCHVEAYTDGSTTFGFGFCVVEGRLILSGCNIQTNYTRLVYVTNTTAEIHVKGNYIDYSLMPTLASPDAFMFTYTGSVLEITNNTFVRGTVAKALVMDNGLGAFGVLDLSYNLTDWISGDLDLGQTNPRKYVIGNRYSTTANSVTTP